MANFDIGNEKYFAEESSRHATETFWNKCRTCVSVPRIFGGEIILEKEHVSWNFRHRTGKSELFYKSKRNAIDHNVPQNFNGTKQQLRGFNNDRNQGHAGGALPDHIPEGNFPKQAPALSKIIRGFHSRIFKEDEELVFEVYQPFPLRKFFIKKFMEEIKQKSRESEKKEIKDDKNWVMDWDQTQMANMCSIRQIQSKNQSFTLCFYCPYNNQLF
jgi:hypothetical protein